MAKTNYRGYLREPIVPLKKYFYVLRPLLAARWVAKTGQAAPIEFDTLLTLLGNEPGILKEVHQLLDQKRNSPELGKAPAVQLLNAFIEAELEIAQFEIPQKSQSPDAISGLNKLFHDALREQFSGDPTAR
jgi:uncharacterized protein